MSTRRILLATCALLITAFDEAAVGAETGGGSDGYATTIVPSDFVPRVTNKYFSLEPGTKYTFRDRVGKERIEVAVTAERKDVMGVATTVVRVREWKNNTLVEETRDWYAQDKAGTVWYFGEAVDNYKDGKLADHQGSWEAGVDGAMPGIIMLGDPRAGETYRQEYYKGKAEDMGTVVALDAKVSVPFGNFEDCLQIRDWSRIEQGKEYKYYCPTVGFLVVEETIGGGERIELIEMTAD
jgi:hypothetical protein